MEDGNKVVDDDYIASVELVALLCRLRSMDTGTIFILLMRGKHESSPWLWLATV